MATCNVMIEGNVVAYACTLELGHDGPHATPENERSMRERRRWEDEKQAMAEGTSLSQFQGTPQTTAERYTENPTPVPLTRQERDESLAQVRQAAPPESPVVYTENVDTGEAAFRPATSAEARVAGVVNTEARPAVLVANDDLIRAGGMHNPYDAFCQRTDVTGPHRDGERCYICRPDGGVAVEHNLADFACEMRDPQSHAGMADQRCPICRAVPEQPSKVRPGDQPLPEVHEGDSVQDRIIAKAQVLHREGKMGDDEFQAIRNTMGASIRVGIERYSTPLQTFNGRDVLQDILDEARDLFVYFSQMMQAREEGREAMVAAVSKALLEQWMSDVDTKRQGTPQEFCDEFAAIAVDVLARAAGLGSTPPGQTG